MTIQWSGRKWLTQERWGQIHPQKPWNWYDPDCVNIDGRGDLNLNIGYNSRLFEVNGEVIKSSYGTGLLCCEDNFGFGTFEIRAKLPKGRGLWPAFWMYPVDAWPPEIDIFEGYSGKRDYRSGCFLKPYDVESCTHSAEDVSKPVRKPWFWKWDNNPSETFNTYTLRWAPDKLIFLINGERVRSIRSIETLNELTKYKMRVVINNHIDKRFVADFRAETPFVVEYFHYENLK